MFGLLNVAHLKQTPFWYSLQICMRYVRSFVTLWSRCFRVLLTTMKKFIAIFQRSLLSGVFSFETLRYVTNHMYSQKSFLEHLRPT